MSPTITEQRHITVPFHFKEEILACGAHLKNTFAMAKGNEVYISPPIGNLENLETLEAFEKGIDQLNIEPKIVAHDLHPEYLSTKYAKKYPKTIAVQHHHAHIASCMADNGLTNCKVIGVAFDGTGYGDDGCIWGGEFLVADYNSYERKAHLKYVPLPGGSQAIKEPWRMAAAYLYKKLDVEKWKIIEKMIELGINSPLTSSMGRLFDAVSSLLGIRDRIDYEAQAAIELEQAAGKAFGIYGYKIIKKDKLYIIDPLPLIVEIVENFKRNIPVSTISANFHSTIAEMIVDVCKLISQETGLTEVALSGGVFQNKILLTKTISRLKEEGFTVYTHNRVPSNDAGISLGQAIVAYEISR